MKKSDLISKLHLTPNTFLGAVIGVAIAVFILLLFLLRPTGNIDVSEEIQTITKNIRKNYQKSFDYRGLNTNIVIEKNLLPEKMIRQNKLFSRLNCEILIGGDVEGNPVKPMDKTFHVVYLNLNKSKCLSLSVTPFDETSGLVKITIFNDSIKEFTYGGEHELPVSQKDAEKTCKSNNKIVFTFE